MTTTVALLTEWIERQFPIGESTSGPLAVTGERYVVVGHMIESPKYPGVIEEGAAPEAGFDEETACMSAASAWSSDHRRCMVYMRLLISDKPQGGL
jgi:hypothetical protein